MALLLDAYRPILGDKHPAALGLFGAVVWADSWQKLLAELRTDTA